MRGTHLAVVLVAVATAALGADPWSKAIAKRGLDPAVVVNPIAITPRSGPRPTGLPGSVGGDGGPAEAHPGRDLRRIPFFVRLRRRNDAHGCGGAAARRGNRVAFTNLFIAMAARRGLPVKAGYMTPRTLGRRRGDLVYVSTQCRRRVLAHDRAVVFDFYRMRKTRRRASGFSTISSWPRFT